MKAWLDCLRVIWRWLEIPVAILMTLWLCYLFIGECSYPAFCAFGSRTRTPKQGNFRAVWITKHCEGFAVRPEDIDMVVLRRIEPDGPDTRVFVYEASMGIDPPDLLWLSPNELEIRLRQVVRIHAYKNEAFGVKITYTGGVDFP